MNAWFKKYWYILVIAAFFIPAAKRPDGSRERLSGFIIRHTVAAIEDTFGAFSFGEGAPAAPIAPAAAPAVALQQTAPPALNAPVVSSRDNVIPRGDLSPVVEITVEGGAKVKGQWLLAGDGGIAHHGNPTVALSDLKTRIPGEWMPVEQPNGRYHFFKRQSS